MLKKYVGAILLCAFLGGCVTEPRDPAFAGAAGINKEAAAKNRVSLGLTYLSNGNFSQAKANLDKALNFAPKSADAHFAMAYYYQQVDELSLAEEYYLQALKFAPENPNIINSYGAFLCEQGRYEKAKSYFLKAATSKSYVSVAETYENLAICAVDQGKTDEAISFFDLALNHQPTRGKSLYFLAQLQKEQGNYGEAKKLLWKYDRVSRVSPESLWLSYEIAQGLGDTKAALGYGELMKSMFPEHPNTALFKKQMGKFQPVATVKNKQRVNSQLAEQATLKAGANNSVENAQTAATESPALIKINKQVKNLKPTIPSEILVAGADIVVDEKPDPVQPELVPRELTKNPTTEVTNTDNAISTNAAEKREAALEAALATDFNSENDESASIEGAVQKVDNTLAIEDKVSEVAVEEAQDTATQQIDKAVNDNASYHVVLPKENLYRISLRYNVKMKYLMQWNNLDDPSAIVIGMKLRVKDPKNND
ncbi:type IV pilus biogenesis/stability protein PilW [Brumicola pallidula]|jgi:type IV pilus assembly protein PilF|uniref:Type IV pilus assembly protein PilF n=1 Tax=Brumicola pallidula DSM 14239 = ACAM 615 TaxID=1121922 RepID=K6Y548_9ALTE|nr:type IV pilus biogenesis/stability protein PilW [Glaciecola pallidula]GAC27909.1 type IV pilus assembly protein PilF [Glaciecola pallidula DSM 14239 = ACAM 615]